MIGDSVSVRVIPAFEEKFPHGYIDAAKNRQFGTGIEIYQSLVDQNLAGGILVFALGTNGPMSDEQIDTLMGIAGADRTVVFVNTRSHGPAPRTRRLRELPSAIPTCALLTGTATARAATTSSTATARI